MLKKYPIAITFEPDREWSKTVIAEDVIVAVVAALEECGLKDGELVHMIHIGPPRPVKI